MFVLRTKKDDRWFWRTVTGLGLELELYAPTTSELTVMNRKFGVLTKDQKDEEYLAFIAREWFRDFRNAILPDGTHVENTIENRELILQAPPVWAYVINNIGAFQDWTNEGN